MALDQLHQRTYGVEDEEHTPVDVVLYSADSHVIEPANLWKDNLPTRFRDDAPDFGGSRPDDVKHGGGTNKYERLEAMDDDGVSIEILYAPGASSCWPSTTPSSKPPASACTTTG